ncbi:polysaccharide biosynthesis protein [Guptibacillus spartinae]|uniref:polysaccharide biosynthesis protein n=1 Tax=Guptibacillus spartinae TaxID=3025679 RepID=UPI0023625F7C|nr:nucleoside-diphosphate sugar epimerase/dehydratase [Pseudalkalibacillus spartinae]
MTYRQRLPFFIFIDSCIVLTAIFFSQFLVGATIHVITFSVILSSAVILISHHLFSFRFNLYKKVWEYASIGELVVILQTVTFSILIAAIFQQFILKEISFRLLMTTWILHLLFIGGSRFCWRMYRDTVMNKPNSKRNTLIVGAGSAGTMVARQLLKNNDSDLSPIGFIDDDRRKQSLDVYGIPVLGGINLIEKKVKDYDVQNIIIAIPSLSKKELQRIFQECAKTEAKTQILPMLEDLMTGKVAVNQFRDVKVEDLLGREPVKLDIDIISNSITNKTVLVTGAGGSIGSEICRQISLFHPKTLILLGHGENSIYAIELELKEVFQNTDIEFVTEIADVQDAGKMVTVMGLYQPDVVYHAAAHKHVPLMERNPEEAVKNNLIGTLNAANAASWSGVKTFVMISSDKAVNPTSVMGATKRLSEMVVQNLDRKSTTKFVAVRFGNVLGSRGSVIPLFKNQIQKGGPITVTHPDMIRFFMTIPEASRLVIQAGSLAEGGEIFVLDMGEPVKIVDLAKNLIKLSGHSVDDIGIEYSGIRPGEKLYEELLNKEEVHSDHVYPNIYVGKTSELYLEEIEELIETFSDMEKEALKNRLLQLANHKVVSQPLLSG